MEPRRIQLSRRKGWSMPENTVNVSRPGPWGNPFTVTEKVKPGQNIGGVYIAVPTVEDAIACFREMLACEGKRADELRRRLPELRGKNLACWCRLDQACHADILLELANRPICEEIPHA